MENTDQQKPCNISYEIGWSYTGNNMFADLILEARLPYMRATIHKESIKLLKTAFDPCPKIGVSPNKKNYEPMPS